MVMLARGSFPVAHSGIGASGGSFDLGVGNHPNLLGASLRGQEGATATRAVDGHPRWRVASVDHGDAPAPAIDHRVRRSGGGRRQPAEFVHQHVFQRTPGDEDRRAGHARLQSCEARGWQPDVLVLLTRAATPDQRTHRTERQQSSDTLRPESSRRQSLHEAHRSHLTKFAKPCRSRNPCFG
jgi:hypothetical protein